MEDGKMEERTVAERAKGIRKGIEQHGKEFRGQKEFLKHLDGELITMKQAILAKCYDCMGYYSDKGEDCELPTCPLYSYMPFRKDKPKREMSEAQKEAMRENLKKARAATSKPPPTLLFNNGDYSKDSTNPPQVESTYTGEVINAKITHRQHGTEGRM